ncbi:hypothetical protein ASPWEDRAFT_44827 [Aspergillus wentii DTO 134E9]|uniref:NAD(P)-binding domain-containing protein n=1 Tax=Aspergillus wentii DTO 134E9 TaxID=1073089 RepID=A0A1L9R7K6_ASPWE|nr:uncharacterized protein ASPWEDRAFT_44827 [Aspergillus wentii DTO 134E9]KAI9927478.1 hypothetical protein MW887_003093 [Aspergillus wentii]OJJ30853.1 hypothetical protein ASPWEDRAFT_44827 [Aspergillus wentii DTO 134E9]
MTNTTVAFFGASAGVGLSALNHTLAAGHQCIALCRNPSKLTAIFPPASTSNLTVMEGNAHDVDAVSKCLQTPTGKLVDLIVTTIGGKPIISKMSVTLDDPHVCQQGATVLLEAITYLRSRGITGNPHIIACSTTGLSRFARDVPLPMVPVYTVMLKVPGEDKKIMEDRFAESGEAYTIVRASRLVDGETDKMVRVGLEDSTTGTESKAIGYSISREDTGKWIAEHLVMKRDARYLNKIATITN